MRLFSCFCVLTFVMACQSADQSSQKESTPTAMNTISKAEEKEGWELLFDGTTKNNWHVFNNKTDGGAWIIADSSLHLVPSQKDSAGATIGGGDIVTNEEYENFHLKLEWKLDNGGNSGIMFNVQEGPGFERTYHTGPEMQVLDNAVHPDAKIIKHRAGDLYDLISSSPETVKPVGQWNAVEIYVNNGSLEFYLNGDKVLYTTMWDSAWNNLIAGSKFKQWQGFGTYKKGRIALQDHGDPVWYRNIKIRKL